MTIKELIKKKNIKAKYLAIAIKSDQSNFSKRLKSERILLTELRVLRNEKLLTLEDIDYLTR